VKTVADRHMCVF